MRYPATTYAKALLAALEGKSSEEQGFIVKRFLAVVKKFGDAGNLKKIFAAVELALTRERGGREVVVESAREIPATLRKELGVRFTSKDLIRERVNQSLIAGIRILIDGEWMVDASLKRRLEKLFANT